MLSGEPNRSCWRSPKPHTRYGDSQLFVLSVKLDSIQVNKLHYYSVNDNNSARVRVLQLIAAYSTPPAPLAPPEAPDFPYDSARLDFKDSDMKRLSMEIERER